YRVPRPLRVRTVHTDFAVKLRILSESDARTCLDMMGAIEAQAEAFALLAAKQTVEGLRAFVPSEAPPAVTIFNPSYLKNGGGFRYQSRVRFLPQRRRVGTAHVSSRGAVLRADRFAAHGHGGRLPHRSADRRRHCAGGTASGAAGEHLARAVWRRSRCAESARR